MSRILHLFFIIAAGLQGCSTLPRDECRTEDAYTVGYQDGLQGRVPRSVADHHKACAKHDVAAKLARYARGHDDGLKQFCSPRNGFSLGLNGAHYNGVCVSGAEQKFLQAYEKGKEISDSELQIRRLGEIRQVNTSELRKLTAAVQRKSLEMVAYDTTPKRRADLLLEMRDLQETVAMVETEINAIEAALEEENRHLQNLRGSTP